MGGLGMTPILPAFVGYIPKGIIDCYNPVYTTPGVNFINILRAAFACTDPKSAKRLTT